MVNKKYFLFGFLFVIVAAGAFLLLKPILKNGVSGEEKAVEEAPVPGGAMQGAAQDWPALNTSLNALLEKNELDKAIDTLAGFNAKNPDFLPALVRTGECYMRKNDFAKAEEYLKKAESLDQADPFVNQVYAELCLAKKDLVNAKKHAEKGVESAKNDETKAFANAGLARVYVAMSDYKSAKEHIEKALKLSPDNKPFLQLSEMIQQNLSGKAANEPAKRTLSEKPAAAPAANGNGAAEKKPETEKAAPSAPAK